VLGALHADDDIAIRWHLNNATSTFYKALEEAATFDDLGEANRLRDNKMEPLLDNLAVLAITCAQYRRLQFLADVRDALYSIYDRAHITDFDRPSLQVELRRTWVWEAIIKRVYTIGAVLIWLKLYDEVPTFIRQPVTFDSYYQDEFWARHALTMRSRDGGLTRQGLCAVTEDFIGKREWFYRVFWESEDNVISSLCQFDFLQCVHAIDESGRQSAGYPSFGVYYNKRTEAMIGLVIKDERVREELLPQLSDERLAHIIRILDWNADSVPGLLKGWNLNDWRDPEIEAFLKEYPDAVR
jgi:hypothetical protein